MAGRQGPGEAADMNTVRRHVLIPVMLTVAAALPAGASAATYCVAKPGCDGTTKADVGSALIAARDTPANDRVEIGPGTFVGLDGFQYDQRNAGSIEIVGAGEDK